MLSKILFVRLLSTVSSLLLLFACDFSMLSEHFKDFQHSLSISAIIGVLLGFGFEDRIRTTVCVGAKIHKLVEKVLFTLLVIYSFLILAAALMAIEKNYLICGMLMNMNFFLCWAFARLDKPITGLLITLFFPNIISAICVIIFPEIHKNFITFYTIVLASSSFISVVFFLNLPRPHTSENYDPGPSAPKIKEFINFRIYATGIISNFAVNFPIVAISATNLDGAAFFIVCYRVYRLYGVAISLINQTLVLEWSHNNQPRNVTATSSHISKILAISTMIILIMFILTYSYITTYSLSFFELFILPMAAFINVYLGSLPSLLMRRDHHTCNIVAGTANMLIIFLSFSVLDKIALASPAVLLATVLSNGIVLFCTRQAMRQ